MVSSVNTANLAMLVGAVAVWAFLGSMWWRWHLASQHLRIRRDVQTFQIASAWRKAGLAMLIGHPVGLLILATIIPVENVASGDWIISGLVGIFLGGLGTYAGLVLWLGRIHVSTDGIQAFSTWYSPGYMRFDDLKTVQLSGFLQAIRLDGRAVSLYVPIQLSNLGQFLALVEARSNCREVSKLQAQDLDINAEYAFHEILKVYAGRIALVSTISAIATAVWVPFQIVPSALAILGGVLLTIYPALRNVLPAHSPVLGNAMKNGAQLGAAVLLFVASSQYGFAGVDGYQSAVILVHFVGTVVAAAAVLLLLTR